MKKENIIAEAELKGFQEGGQQTLDEVEKEIDNLNKHYFRDAIRYINYEELKQSIQKLRGEK